MTEGRTPPTTTNAAPGSSIVSTILPPIVQTPGILKAPTAITSPANHAPQAEARNNNQTNDLLSSMKSDFQDFIRLQRIMTEQLENTKNSLEGISADP